MRKFMKQVSKALMFVLVVSVFSGIIPAQAASKWAFSTSDGEKKVSVGGTVTFVKGEYQDMNLYMNGKQIKENDASYSVKWYTSDASVVYIDKKSGEMRADKYGKMTKNTATAKITAVIANKKTGGMTKQKFTVKVTGVSGWAFRPGNEEMTKANNTITLQKDANRVIKLYKDGTKVDGTYTVRWYTSDRAVVYVDKNSGEMHTDKYGKMAGDTAKATITAVIKNNKTGNEVKKRFVVRVVSSAKQVDSGFSAKKAKVGKYVTLGSYEQDNVLKNGKEAIEWLVLDVKDGQALLLSRYALDAKPYHKTWTDVTWEESSIRAWLNKEFYNTAFTTTEKGAVLTTVLENPDNPKYETEGGNDTRDKVFLLSIEEATKYFPEDTFDEELKRFINPARATSATPYAAVAGAYCTHHLGEWDDDNCYYWLRSPGYGNRYKPDVYYNGYLDLSGYVVHAEDHAVRPAIWVNLVP